MKKFYSILLTLALVLTTVSVPVVMAADAAWAFDYEFNNITSSEYSSSLTKGTKTISGKGDDRDDWKVNYDVDVAQGKVIAATDDYGNTGMRFLTKKASSNVWSKITKHTSYGDASFKTGDAFYFHTEFSSRKTYLDAGQTNFVMTIGGVSNIDIVTCTKSAGIKIGADGYNDVIEGSDYGNYSDRIVSVYGYYYPDFETYGNSRFVLNVSHNGASYSGEKKLSELMSEANLAKLTDPLIGSIGYRMRITDTNQAYETFVNKLIFEPTVQKSAFEYSEDFQSLGSEIYNFSNLTTKYAETVTGTNDARDGWSAYFDATDVKSAVLKKATNDHATGMLFEVEDGDVNFYAKVDKQIESGKYNNAGRLFANGEVFHINTAFSSCWSNDDASQTNLFVNIGGVYDIDLVSCFRDETGIKIGNDLTGITFNNSAGHPVYVDVYYTPDFVTPADSEFVVMLTHNGNTAEGSFKLSDVKNVAYTDPSIDAVGYRMRIFGTDNAKRNVMIYNLDYGFAPDFEISTQAISGDKIQAGSNKSIAHVYANDGKSRSITVVTAAYNAQTNAFIKLNKTLYTVETTQIITDTLDTSDITDDFYIRTFVIDSFSNIRPYIPAVTYSK